MSTVIQTSKGLASIHHFACTFVQCTDLLPTEHNPPLRGQYLVPRLDAGLLVHKPLPADAKTPTALEQSGTREPLIASLEDRVNSKMSALSDDIDARAERLHQVWHKTLGVSAVCNKCEG